MNVFRYIFPGVGLGSVAVEATSLTDADFYTAAAALAEKVSRYTARIFSNYLFHVE